MSVYFGHCVKMTE